MLKRLLGDDIEASGRYLAEIIYGANDGIVTTFAGAALDPAIVLVLGAANLFADDFSMGMCNYLSRRSEQDYQRLRHENPDVGTAGLEEDKSPWKTAVIIFLAFVVAEWAALLPYIIVSETVFLLSIGFTGVAFFTVGTSRSLVSRRRWKVNGTEMFVVAMAAAVIVITVGTSLGGLA